mgnify:FL=1
MLTNAVRNLNFDKVQAILAQKQEKDPEFDLDQIDPVTADFFKKLVFSTSTAPLDEYTQEVIEGNIALLSGQLDIIGYIQNLIEDSSILGNMSALQNSMLKYHYKQPRRLL